jgi:DtxR family Mn-dependent transcriptional regulator
VQVDHEALSLLTSAGLLPGQRVDVRREDGRVIAVREGGEEATGVSLPQDVAQHVFAAVV